MSIDNSRQRLSNFEFVDLVGPVQEVSIAAAEQELGVHFPPQYRSFLSEFGCGGVNSEEFIGLGGPDHLDIVKLSLCLRARNNPLPIHLLPLRGDGFGNYDCLDTSQPTNKGEFAITQWVHEKNAADHCELLAQSYDDWLELILDMIKANA